MVNKSRTMREQGSVKVDYRKFNKRNEETSRERKLKGNPCRQGSLATK